jgi:hypothetical protein
MKGHEYSLSPCLYRHGERVRVRGGHAYTRWRLSPPLTPTFSPQAGRGGA